MMQLSYWMTRGKVKVGPSKQKAQ